MEIENNKKLAKDISNNFKKLIDSGDIEILYNGIFFRMGCNHAGYTFKFTDKGFKESVLNVLRKMKLPQGMV